MLRIAGISIGLIKNGKKYYYNFGYYNKEKKLKPTNQTIYEIASVTKSFTGAILLKWRYMRT